MAVRGYSNPLYILPFDHRGSFETGMFGWKGDLSPEQTAQMYQTVTGEFATELRRLNAKIGT